MNPESNELRALVRALESVAPGAIRTNVLLSTFSRWRIGGPAAVVVEPRTSDEAMRTMATITEFATAAIVVGETSNLLFDSRGFDGAVVRVASAMSRWEIDGTRIRAQAGARVPDVANAAAERGLTGIEHTVGIPGTLGGLVLMNGGSQRRGIGENVERVTFVDCHGALHNFDKAACGFAYRTSSLQRMSVLVVEVELSLRQGVRETVMDSVTQIIAERQTKFPTDYPNCGSTFLSDPAMYATVGPPGRAIEEAGLKGVRIGDAQVSDKHANFLLNLGSATSNDMLKLISLVRNEVYVRTGYLMSCEVRHVDPAGVIRPAHEVTVAE